MYPYIYIYINVVFLADFKTAANGPLLMYVMPFTRYIYLVNVIYLTEGCCCATFSVSNHILYSSFSLSLSLSLSLFNAYNII